MRRLLLFAAALWIIPFAAGAAESLPQSLPKPLPRLSIEGNRFVDETGMPVTLRGVSLCSLEWHKPLEQIRDVTTPPTKWNANILRLPVQLKEWDRVGPQDYIKDYLDPAVKACTERGIYCIIDWHAIDKWSEVETAKKLENFWTIVAPRYAANPNILYEVFNEPAEPKGRTIENWLAWRESAQTWVDLIRKRARKTPILVGSPHWSQMPSFAVQEPFEGNNLAYVVHVYPIWKERQWDELFGDASKTIPIFITEWGWSAQEKSWWGIKGNREDYGDKLRAYLDARPWINWTAWSYDPKCGPAMLGGDKDMGEFVQEWLKDVNP
jgi:endoglucanase